MTPLRILGETAYPAAVASARVRVVGFTPYLAAQQVSLVHRPALTDDDYALLQSSARPERKALALARSAARLATRRTQHDLLLVHRLRLMAPLPGYDPPHRLDVYDLDDALFLGSSAAVNRRFGWAKQEARRCVACMRRARLVIAGNAYLADHARQLGAARVAIVPSCVAPEHQPVREHADSDVITVGWMGSQSTSEYLAAVLPALERLNSDGVRFRLVIVGARLGVRAPWIEQRAWSARTQAGDLASFDVGIMPLRDSPWARGKCGYKLLQYFAAGVPAVASPVGVNREMIGSDRGLLAESVTDWERALRELASDPARRRQHGAAARSYVERDYSYTRWAPELADLLRSLAG